MNRRGFTLIEVLLATGLMVVVMAGWFALADNVRRVREVLDSEPQLVRVQTQIMDMITEELRFVMADDSATRPEFALLGGSDRIRYFTVALPSLAAWVDPDATTEFIPPELDRRRVRYQLEIDPDTEEVLGIERILLKNIYSPNRNILYPDPDSVEVATRLTEQIKFLRFRYHIGVLTDGWGNGWTQPELPLAVEITLGTEPLPEDMEVDEYLTTYETRTRVVYLPGSTNKMP